MYNFLVANRNLVTNKSFMDGVNSHKLPFVLISVLSPEYRDNELDISKGMYCQEHLTIKFHDINYDGSVNSLKPVTRKITPISEEHARELIRLVLKWKDKVNNFLIHCEAGMSRSPGVALALSEILNGKKNPRSFVKTIYDINLHNSKVKDMILKVWYEEFSNDSE
jgi:predicted protein tyrosine phosphatase